MKPDQSFQIFFLISFLSFLFSSGDVFAYKESDFYKLKNTKKCIECDLTDLNLSRLNLREINLSRSDLSGSDLSGSDLSRSNLSGVNLSRVNLSGTNLKNVNLTGTNLKRIIIDVKALSTLDLSESTFLNKSTLAEEAKKKKERALKKKKKEQELKKKKEQALRKKKAEEIKKRKEKELRKKKAEELIKKKEQALRKKKAEELRVKKEQALRKKKEDELQDYFEAIFLEAPNLIGSTVEIVGEIGTGNKTGSDTQYIIYDIDEPEHYKFRFVPELNHLDSNHLKQQLDWVLRNCIVKKCKHILKIKILWAKESKIPLVKIVEIDSPKTNYKLNLNDIDATAIALYHNEIVNERIKMDIIFAGGERHMMWPLKYWGNGKFEYDNLPNSIKKMFKESHLLGYHFAESGEVPGTKFDYENGIIPKKFKKIILKKCSDSEWRMSIFWYNTWELNKSRKDCHFKISAIFRFNDYFTSILKTMGPKYIEENEYRLEDHGMGFENLIFYNGPSRYFSLSNVKFLNSLN